MGDFMKNQYFIYTRTAEFRYLKVVAIIMALIHLPAHAATFTVTNLNDSGSDSLRQAIMDANNAPGDDTITFESGMSGTITLTGTNGRLIISGNLAINGPGANALVVSGNRIASEMIASQIFSIDSGVVVAIDGLTIKEGYSQGSCGGIDNRGILTVSNSILSGNAGSLGEGGGICNWGTLTVSNSTLSGNFSYEGGGIANHGTLTVNNSTLSRNGVSAFWGSPKGGGIFNSGTLTINNSALFANTVSNGKGGGIYNSGAMTAKNSAFYSNSSNSSCSRTCGVFKPFGTGGGIENRGTLTISNSTLSRNWTDSSGGGIENRGTLTISNSTLSGNSATGAPMYNLITDSFDVITDKGNGGGIANYGVLTLGNSLVAGNYALTSKEIGSDSGGAPPAVFISQGHNLFGENRVSGVEGGALDPSDLVLAGPLGTAIGPLGNNGGPTLTHFLVAGSPAINSGDNSLIPAGVTTDQRGFPRIQNGVVDIGAVEVNAFATQDLITHYYQFILSRTPDGGGLAFWQSEIDRLIGLVVDTQEAFRVMAGWFFSSPEYLSKNTSDSQYVTDLYRTFFHRDPDGGGLSFWAGQLAQGMPRSVVLFSFLFSAEFFSYTQGLLGSTNSRAEVYAVVDFYRGFLNRLPDTNGFGYWINRFRVAQCQGAAAINAEVNSISTQFLGSGEYTGRNRTNRDYVADLYYAFLRRGGELTGFDFWVSQLDNGLKTREQLRQEFLNSPEFQARVSQIISQGCLN